jgi:hypothetical protein
MGDVFTLINITNKQSTLDYLFSLCSIKPHFFEAHEKETVEMLAFLTSAVGGHSWSESRTGHFSTGAISFTTHLTGGL